MPTRGRQPERWPASALQNLLRSAVVESVYDLATERFESYLSEPRDCAARGSTFTACGSRPQPTRCMGCAGLVFVQLVSHLLGQPFPQLELFAVRDTPGGVERVVALATDDFDVGIVLTWFLTFAGPRHLARLLRHLADDLFFAGVLRRRAA